MTFTPTDEQRDILAHVRDSRANLLVTARAGAAKTSTIEMAIREQEAPCAYLAFNRATVLEAKQRVPDSCDVFTLNGLGHRSWGRFLRTRLDLRKSKLYDILSDSDYKGELFSEMLRACRLAKQAGFVPAGSYSLTPKPLLTEDEFFASLEFNLPAAERELVVKALRLSLMQAIEGVIDFDDQILCPAIFPISFERKGNLCFIDEAQDLSPINQTMIRKAYFGARLVAVGDQAQAIYGFRGASQSGMDDLREMFKMEERKLTMTFRCAEAIVEHANWRTNDMRAYRSGGMVRDLGSNWSLESIPDGSAILCRNNAPILRLAVQALSSGLAPHFAGRDLFSEMTKTIRKISKKITSSEDLLTEIDKWEVKQRGVWKSVQAVQDRADCLRVMARSASTVSGVLAYIKSLSSRSEGSFTLSTCHKAKGMEWDEVFILHRALMNLRDPQSQDKNLLYVAQTRARDTLNYIE